MKRLKYLLPMMISAILFSAGFVKAVSVEVTNTPDVYVDNIETVEEKLTSIDDKLDFKSPYVTVVYSINNTIDGCYYKPELSDIPHLEQKILQKGFISAYTGFFDLNNTTGGYKPEGVQSRALELLGYDLLLESESYDGSSYQAVRTPEDITWGTALMDIYKALHLSQIHVIPQYSRDDTLRMETSPVAIGLPAFVNGVNTEFGRTDVFVTRTNKELYYQKAAKDLGVSKSNMNVVMTNGEFIVLLARMMHYYGEPVLSETEENILLQVYGAEIPTYLTAIEQDAYLYLKSRGVLNSELDYSKALQLTDMLEILMCVYDEGSRTDYKQIQLTMDIGSELVSRGYFPRQVEVAVGAEALELDVSYDYSNVKYYDYYIKVDDRTRFVQKNSASPVNYVFIPTEPTNEKSEELPGAKYYGIEQVEGVEYYHISVPILRDDSDYMKRVKKEYGETGYIQVNTENGSDYPAYLWMEQGGGVYEFGSGPNSESGIVLKRAPFTEGSFDGAASIERREGEGEPVSVLKRLRSFIFGEPAVAHANEAMDWENSLLTTVKIYNAENIVSYSDDIINFSFISKGANEWVVRLPSSRKDYFLASIVRDQSKTKKTSYRAIASLSGDILVKYDDLVEAGVFYNDADGVIPVPESADNGSVLILNSEYGQVKLNQETREIIVGNTMYRVKNDKTVLFSYVLEEGKNILYVDFRAAYGWTGNISKMAITGNGEHYTVNMQTVDSGRSGRSLGIVFVEPPPSFKTYAVSETMQIIPKGVLLDNKSAKAVMVSEYTLANWMIFQGYDRMTGTTKDYVFVFYPKSAFQSGEAPNDLERMRNIVGYSLAVENWVCRVFELSGQTTDEIGKFTYTEEFGYVYNLPDWDDFTMDKYLSGEYVLPIAQGSAKIVNANVNAFDGCPYGTRPLDAGTDVIDIKGIVKANVGNEPAKEMYAAPAGVSAFYGGNVQKIHQANSEMIRINQSQSNSNDVFYYGTSKCKMLVSENGDTYAEIKFTGQNPLTQAWKVADTQKFYLVKVMAAGTVGLNEITTYLYRWCMFDNVVSDISSTEQEIRIADEDIKIIDAENKDTYTGEDEFTLSRILEYIDFGTSYAIVFVLEILPIVGIILVTILLGLSLMSDVKIVQLLCAKYFDPVKLLTFGTHTIENFRFQDAFISLLLAYTAFALILNGNLLRILMYLSEAYGRIKDYIRLL